MKSQVSRFKKLVEMSFMHHQRCEIDRRAVRGRLTEKGRNIRDIVAELFARHADGLMDKGVIGMDGIEEINTSLRRVERYWTDQIRYIYLGFSCPITRPSSSRISLRVIARSKSRNPNAVSTKAPGPRRTDVR